ncbi:Protein CBG26509 [Caenorhabditis briggsae]|uniref:Protein CBG26509 n=1 Tax=Caenorhabditis briggsae TaxID=6238 RepID=B6IG32_CAEBR|nr:Protein CBG26509 [Caenorhabditis briggsae]CAR98862.1 Protein CBG26509 [Caenorhabditis briggsae]
MISDFSLFPERSRNLKNLKKFESSLVIR